MATSLLPCQHPVREQVRGGACFIRAGRSALWAYCPQCDLFAIEPTPELSSQERQHFEEDLRSFVKMAVERDRAAVAARDAAATPGRPT